MALSARRVAGAPSSGGGGIGFELVSDLVGDRSGLGGVAEYPSGMECRPVQGVCPRVGDTGVSGGLARGVREVASGRLEVGVVDVDGGVGRCGGVQPIVQVDVGEVLVCEAFLGSEFGERLGDLGKAQVLGLDALKVADPGAEVDAGPGLLGNVRLLMQ